MSARAVTLIRRLPKPSRMSWQLFFWPFLRGLGHPRPAQLMQPTNVKPIRPLLIIIF